MLRRWLPGLVILALLAWFIARLVDPAQMRTILQQADPHWLLWVLALKVAASWSKAIRWRLAMQTVLGFSPTHTFSGTVIGLLGNLIFPARLGEILRAHIVQKNNQGVSHSLALTSNLLTQLFDVLLLCCCLLLGAMWVQGADIPLWQLLLLLSALLSLFVGLFVFHVSYERFTPWGIWAGRWLPEKLRGRLGGVFEQIHQGLGLLRDVKALALVFSLTLLLWCIEAACYGLILKALRIELSWGMLLLLTGAANLAFLLPLTPGALGVHQLVCIWVLGFAAIPREAALLYSLTMQICDMVMILALGGFFFLREGISLRQVQHKRA
jgi:uncharacterized protein (TIRG00374 family)